MGTLIENFRVSEKSLDNQRSTILTGEKALFLEGGIMSLSNPCLVTVNSKGKTNLVKKFFVKNGFGPKYSCRVTPSGKVDDIPPSQIIGLSG